MMARHMQRRLLLKRRLALTSSVVPFWISSLERPTCDGRALCLRGTSASYKYLQIRALSASDRIKDPGFGHSSLELSGMGLRGTYFNQTDHGKDICNEVQSGDMSQSWERACDERGFLPDERVSE
jgi:hypothetical protein